MQKGTFPFSFSITKSKHLDRFVTKLRAIDDDLTNIKIPGRRYDTIEEAVLNMYIKANIHEIPVPIQDVIGALKCKLYAYSAMGEKVAKELLHCSLDAVAIQYPSCENSRILFNDKQPFCRQKFSIFHEIGHLVLGHQEPSNLAEKEANHFAATALCPLPLLEHYNILDINTIAQVFEISEECAANRLRALEKQRHARHSFSNINFRRNVIKQLTNFKEPIQTDLFSDYGN